MYSDIDLLRSLTGCCKVINSTFEMEESTSSTESMSEESSGTSSGESSGTTETTRPMESASSESSESMGEESSESSQPSQRMIEVDEEMREIESNVEHRIEEAGGDVMEECDAFDDYDGDGPTVITYKPYDESKVAKLVPSKESSEEEELTMDEEERRKFEQRSLKKPKKPEPIFDNNIEIAQAKKLSKKDREQDWNEMATEETIPYPHNNYKDFSSYSEKNVI